MRVGGYLAQHRDGEVPPSYLQNRMEAQADEEATQPSASRLVSEGGSKSSAAELYDISMDPVSADRHETSQGKLACKEHRRVTSLGGIRRQPSCFQDGFEGSSLDRPGRLRLLRSSSSLKHPLQGMVFSDLPRRVTKRESNASRNGFSTSLRDVLRRTGSAVRVSTDPAQLRECEAMLVYLNRQTWGRGDASLAFGRHVALALSRGMPLLLGHEMPSIEDDDRHGCQFALFFESGQTPQALINAGIYHTVAVPLKGGDYRPISIALLTRKLIEISRSIHTKSQDLRTVTRALHGSMAMIVSDESLSGNSDRSSADADTAAVEHESELPAPQRFPPPSHEAQMPTVDAIPTELTLSELVTVQSDDIIETNKDNEGMRESMTTSRAAVAVTDVRLEEKKQQPFEINKAQDNHDQDVEKGRPSEPLSVEADDVLSEDAISAQATMCIADAALSLLLLLLQRLRTLTPQTYTRARVMDTYSTYE